MMRVTDIRLMVLASCIAWTLAVPGQGFARQPDVLGSDFNSSPEEGDSSRSAAADSSRFTFHYQVGLLYRIGGTEIYDHTSEYVWNKIGRAHV